MLDKKAQKTLTHYGVGDVHSSELTLLRAMLKAALFNHPVIERAVIAEFCRTERVCYALDSILYRMRKVVHRVDAPCVALTVMMNVTDAVYDRIAQIGIIRIRVYLRAQGACAVGEFALLHAAEEVEALLCRTVAVGGYYSLIRIVVRIAAVALKILARKVAHVCIAVAYQLYGIFVALLEIIRAVVYTAVRLRAEPAQILVYRADVFVALFHWVGIIISEVEEPAVLLCGRAVYPYRLCGADMKITVRLGRKTSMHCIAHALPHILINYIVYKISCRAALGAFVFKDVAHVRSFLFLFYIIRSTAAYNARRRRYCLCSKRFTKLCDTLHYPFSAENMHYLIEIW